MEDTGGIDEAGICGVGPMMMTAELTLLKHGFRVWRATTRQWMLSSSHSTALVKTDHGTLLKVDVMLVPGMCS